MGNPPLLLCDSDALTQFFLADEVRPLRELKAKYGIQPAIVQEVDTELRWMRKFKNRFVAQLDKTLKATTLKILDAAEFQSHLSTAPVGASWASFQSLGSRYNGFVDWGEAYTFAAAVTLGFPALSNDFSAIRVLEGKMQNLPTPILRSFDLLAFCFNNCILSSTDCETVRSALLKESEGLPKAFQNASFEAGIRAFNTRLQEGAPGMAASSGDYKSTLTIARLV